MDIYNIVANLCSFCRY